MKSLLGRHAKLDLVELPLGISGRKSGAVLTQTRQVDNLRRAAISHVDCRPRLPLRWW